MSRAGPLSIETPEQLRELMRADFTFSSQQFAAITAPLEPGVVIAGAGAGKTTVMAARVVWLVATGQLAPEQVLGLTFTNKAAGELAMGVREALRSAGILPAPGERRLTADDGDNEALEPTIATYNAYAANLLTEHGLRIGHEPDTRVITDASRYQLAARTIARYDGRIALLSDHPPTVINYLLSLDSAMSEHLVSPDDVRRFQADHWPRFEAAALDEPGKTKRNEIEAVLHTFARRAELLGLVEAYRDLKAKLVLMDFSDQIELAARLVADHRDVGVTEREKFKIVLLDEYQDTSVAQALMLQNLFSGADPAGGRGHPVTAVGDPNQAIYGWRGASVSNILGFGTEFPLADGTPADAHALTVSRRCDRTILALANELAAPLLATSEAVLPLESTTDAGPGVVRTAVFETADDELGWLPTQVKAAYTDMRAPNWAEIGVLTRDNAQAAAVFDVLSDAEIPVEIVGLQGLLRLPEVAEVVSTLTLLHDLTANAELLMLLSGPRWAIGERDLALLGQRAGQLAGDLGAGRRRRSQTLEEELASAVEGADPTEVPSLSDALDSPGEADYSIAARERFELLSAELSDLRRHAGEPLLDLVRRIIDTTGLDVELSSSISPAATARRDNLDLFVKAVAEFEAIDGAVTLPALLAYLQAEDEFGTGLDAATPTDADSVKLLTVHRAKGLEWDAVFLVGVCEDKFPITRGRTKWTKGPGILPNPLRGDAADQPQLRGHDAAALEELTLGTRAHQASEELRLAYVAVTRARHLLVMSSYCWAPQRKTPLGPSPYQQSARDIAAMWDTEPDCWLDKPERGAANPLHAHETVLPWPVEAHRHEVERRLTAAAAVTSAIDGGPDTDPVLDILESMVVAEWDADLDRLLAEARRTRADVVAVRLPPSLPATAIARLRDEPARFARDLARPMPRKPSSAARFGTRFHAWIEAQFGQQQIIDPDDLPGRGDADIDSESDLARLVKAFESGAFADRVPLHVEAPFALVLAGQVVRGRIDAVYETDGRYLVVDWKTNRQQTADQLQLALYRVAWAELMGVDVVDVDAAFYYVRTDDLVIADELPTRDQLEALLVGD